MYHERVGILEGMAGRALACALLLGVEGLAVSLAFDGGTITAERGALGAVRDWGAWTLRWALASALLFGALVWQKGNTAAAGSRFRPGWLLGNLAVFGMFWTLGTRVYGGEATAGAAIAGWLAAGIGMVITAAMAVARLADWAAFARTTGWLGPQAALAAAIGCAAGLLSWRLWGPVTLATFSLSEMVLGLFRSEYVSDPDSAKLGTSRFFVFISQECSGLEGVGLMLVCGLMWLTVFRSEFRFPRALLLLPAGMVLIYLSNVARIVVLILIGDAGYREIAARGFHSQAGWLAFCAVTIGFMVVSGRSDLFRAVRDEDEVEYAAAPYLAPFLAVMAAAVVSQAMTGSFEWMYVLRIPAAIAALLYFRTRYRTIDWRFGWPAAAAGFLVFAVWAAYDLLMGGEAAGMPVELRNASSGVRVAWLAARCVSAAIAVPVVEELAFRGFCQRRLQAEDFDRVPWTSWNWPGLIGASTVFGLLHGSYWHVGTVAGAIYGGVMVYRGRLGEAVAAHAITNGLLAAYVLATGRWQMWA